MSHTERHSRYTLIIITVAPLSAQGLVLFIYQVLVLPTPPPPPLPYVCSRSCLVHLSSTTVPLLKVLSCSSVKYYRPFAQGLVLFIYQVFILPPLCFLKVLSCSSSRYLYYRPFAQGLVLFIYQVFILPALCSRPCLVHLSSIYTTGPLLKAWYCSSIKYLYYRSFAQGLVLFIYQVFILPVLCSRPCLVHLSSACTTAPLSVLLITHFYLCCVVRS